MNRTQQYLLSMLDRLPVWELSGDAPRSTMDRLKDRLANADDPQPEIRRLFRVRGFSDFALGLLWITDKVERDPARVDSTEEEERFMFSLFRKAMASTGPVSSTDTEPAPPAEPEPGFVPTLEEEPAPSAGPASEPEPRTHAAPESGEHPERQFSGQLDRLVEALQSASEDREAMLTEAMATCDAMSTLEGAGEDLKEFSVQLKGFLQYVSSNQLIDDVRVMNIVSNAQEPFAQWARLGDTERAGLLDQAIAILRDSKAMFE